MNLRKYINLIQLKANQTTIKTEYNDVLKIYNKVKSNLMQIHKKLEILNLKIVKNKRKLKMIMIQIDDEFFKYFKENLNRLNDEVLNFLHFFFGITMTKKNLISVKI